MGLFDRLLRMVSAGSRNAALTPSPPPGAPAMLKAWDAFGRTVEIPWEQWRTEVLPVSFQKAWNEPDDLANLITVSLNDGFIADCLKPARHLQSIDPQPKRGAHFLAVVLLRLGKHVEAAKVLNRALRQHGDDAALLANLARAQSGQGNPALAEGTLWHSLELDPNVHGSVGWYEAIHRERDGETAGFDALRRIAGLSGSWLAQTWLARAALQSRNLDEALAIYRQCLANASSPAPRELLEQISGDLGETGHLPELLLLVEPLYVAENHGLGVGSNLIKAYFDLGQLDSARQILNRLYALNRPDWKDCLSYWETEINKMRLSISHPANGGQMQFTMLTIEGPVWLPPRSPAAELFPAKEHRGASVCFLGGTAEVATNSKRAEYQLADTPGRLSRSLPLYVAEQVEFGSNAKVRVLTPMARGETSAFAVGGVPWEDADAVDYARAGADPCDYVVTLHLRSTAEPWSVDLRLVRIIDGQRLTDLTAPISPSQLEEGLPALTRQLMDLLQHHAEVELTTAPLAFHDTVGSHLSLYLLLLDQILAIRCSAIEGVGPELLLAPRNILDGAFQFCLEEPRSIHARIMLANCLLGLKRIRSEILPEYSQRFGLLQKSHPLNSPAQGVVQRLGNEAFDS